MIVNRAELLSSGDIEAKKIALRLMEKALEESSPYNAVKKCLALKGDSLVIGGQEFLLKGDVYLLAFGKAACLMAKLAEEILGERVKEGLAITKYGYSLPLRMVRVIEAGHPTPDENSVRGTQLALELVRRVRESDTLLVLISGGGSSLLICPHEGISLQDKIKVNDLLLRSGAKIHEINTVRKHISRVKGGGLAKLSRGVLVSLILSDVVGDPLEVIASGPTVKDPTTFHEAYRVLRLYNLWGKLPESVRHYLTLGLKGGAEETLKKDLPHVHNFLIGGVGAACEAMKEEAEQLGLRAQILTTTLEGEARDVALALGSIVAEIHHKNRPLERPGVLIAGGETTVTILGEAGLGGPNQEFALSIARKIRGLRGAAALAVDTDGTDGPTDAAGGLADSFTLELLEGEGIDVEEHLTRHSSYEGLRKGRALVTTGPTGTNVNSVYVMVIL